MNKRTIIFRADGGPTIGMGHFIRTLALAEMLKDDFYCIYATQTPTPYQISEIEKVCHERIDLPNDETHFDVFLDYLKGNEIVVLDNYYFTTDYQQLIKNKGCKLVCIDDMHDKHYVADIVINHAFKQRNQFSCEKTTKLLLGLDYALIRKDFRINSNSTKINNSLLINFGGSDYYDLTTTVLNFLLKKRINESHICYVLVGNANKFHNSIEKLCKLNSIEYYKDLNAENLNILLGNIEFAILPASTILIEALSRKVNVIGGYYVENQKEFFNYLEKSKMIYPIDNLLNSNNYEKIIDGLRNFKYSREISFFNVQNNLLKSFSNL